ncbi:MAG: 3'-5' exonuclease [Burkholderiales bacterium]|nr:3'-5' exonuclease [Burkholderiales bacterium]
MGWFDRWRGRGKEDDDGRLRAWRALPRPARHDRLDDATFVVVDTETGGLDPHAAALLSVGVCRIRHRTLELSDTFEAHLRQAAPTPDDNILVHGIGRAQQSEGRDCEDVLLEFLAFAGRPWFVGFHAGYDATVLSRALRTTLGVSLDTDWLDVAMLLPALTADAPVSANDLDGWLDRCGVRNFARHSALADAFATAELFLVVLARAHAHGMRTVGDLLALQHAHLRRRIVAQSTQPGG